MRLYITLIAINVCLFSFAQNYNPAIQVSKSDLELNSYERDSTANSLIIYDYGNSYVDDESFWLKFQLQQKIKILRKEGVEQGEVEIVLYKGSSSKEKVQKIRGATYNLENGQIVKTELTPEAIFREENEKYTLVKFVLPNVKVGSVITYSYEKESRFISKYQPWYFQQIDPVLYSEYNTSIPANYEYNIKLVGSIPLDTHDTSLERECIKIRHDVYADCSIAKYVMKNIPAYKSEDFTTTPLNYMARIEYELSVMRGFDGSVDKITNTWEYADKELKTDSNFGRQINKKSLVKNVLPEEINTISNPLEKAKAIYYYVLDNYRWNQKSERFDVSIKDLIKEKNGGAFEINLLLQNLLSAEDIEAHPVLISTRSSGLATKLYPILTEFDYVILKATIDEKDYFLDATNPYLSFGELPFRCLNQYGRLVNFEYGSYWQEISVPTFSYRQHRIELNLSGEEAITGTIESNFNGYHAHESKRRFDENPTDYKKKKADTYATLEINNHSVIDFNKKNTNFKEKIDFTLEPELIGNKIYLNPFLIKFFDENPFKLQERTYPIDFGYKDSYSYALSISLDEDLKIVEIPKPVNMALPNNSGSFIFNVETNNNKLILYFKVKFNQAIYKAGYYRYLKEFMSNVVDTQKNSVIVLEKL